MIRRKIVITLFVVASCILFYGFKPIDSLVSGYHLTRGNSYFQKGDYDRAITEYTKALDKVSDAFGAYHNRGLAYGIKGQYDQAISDYTKAIEINPKYVDAYHNRGIA